MKLAGYVIGSTPSAGVANWVLEGTSSTVGAIQEFSWSGGATSSTAMRSRIARDSVNGTGSRTTGLIQRLDQSVTSPGNTMFFSTAYASSPPTIVVGALYAEDWNAYGGKTRWLAAPGEEIILVQAVSVECRQDLGIATSTYGVVWTEF